MRTFVDTVAGVIVISAAVSVIVWLIMYALIIK